MLQVRDFVWGVAIAVGLVVLAHYRPLWSARSFVEQECAAGFRHAYAGQRYLDGEVITPADGAGAHLAPVPEMVKARSMKIDAEEITMTGRRARFVIHHLVVSEDGSPSGAKRTADFHVELEKRDGRWTYSHFQPRGDSPVQLQADVNPFVEALQAARGTGWDG